jgi:hypothetical protein
MLGLSATIVKLPTALRFTERSGLDMVLASAWYFAQHNIPGASWIA